MNLSACKVLFQNRDRENWIGGDVVQMDKTIMAIKDHVKVTINEQPVFTPALLYTDFDIVHLWNFSMEWTKYQFWVAAKHKKKIVCSMIYHETDKFIPYEHQQIMVDNIDALIFLTEGEVERARKHLSIPDEKVFIIPNGIDALWLDTKKQKWNESGYVLTVGRVDGTKGQLETAKACAELGLQYICVGEILDRNYARQCIDAGAKILPPMSHDQLIKVYDNARLYVLASSTEIFPLTVMEAGARKLNSVVTDSCEWKDIPQVEWCKWQDVESIKTAIKKSLDKPVNKKFHDTLKDMTWEKVGSQVLDIYKHIWQKKEATTEYGNKTQE